MLKRRLIPVVLMRGGVAVQSKGFTRHPVLGDPVAIVERLASWASDELIYLDITRDGRYDRGRDDLAGANRRDLPAILADIAARCSMPLTFGGGIRTLQGAALHIEAGADKVALTTAAADDPSLIGAIADRFGSQCVVVGLDVRRATGGHWDAEVFADGGRRSTGVDAVTAARRAVDAGAGELLLQSIDRDGRRSGYDVDLIAAVAAAVPVPVIALGGVGEWSHLEAGLAAGADAVAAANIFNHVEHAAYHARCWLHERGHTVRPPELVPDTPWPASPTPEVVRA